MRRPYENPTTTHDQQPEAMRMGLENGVQSRVRHVECEWRRTSRARKRRQQVAATTAKTVWWRGNRYDVLGEDAHTLPMGGRFLLRESGSGPYGPRGSMPYIKLCSYRGTVVGERGESTSLLLLGPTEPTRNDAEGWTQVNPKPRAFRYSVLSFDRIGRWWRECKKLGLGRGARVRVSDPAMQTDMPRSPEGGQQGPMTGTGPGPVTPRHDDAMGTMKNPGGHEISTLASCHGLR